MTALINKINNQLKIREEFIRVLRGGNNCVVIDENPSSNEEESMKEEIGQGNL